MTHSFRETLQRIRKTWKIQRQFGNMLTIWIQLCFFERTVCENLVLQSHYLNSLLEV